MLLLPVILTLVTCSWSYPICPHGSKTAAQPRFTKVLGEFDYVEHGKSVAVQCCCEGYSDIRWSRLERGHWVSFPPVHPDISNVPRLEEQNQILRIYEADFEDNTTYKCEVESNQTADGEVKGTVLQHQLELIVVACDNIARGPIITKPFPQDQYIDDFGGNITLSCSGYFGCSDDGITDGDAYWQVKEHGVYKFATKVCPRYSVFKYSNEGKTMRIANLTISPVMPEDLGREFVCKLASAQLFEGQTSQTVRIYKNKGPFNIALLVGIVIAGVVVLVVIFLLSTVVIVRLWGPQIKWYLRSRISFIGPNPELGEDLVYNAFLYHADEDIAVADELKRKLMEQKFEIFLSSDVPGNRATMASYQSKSESSAVVIFLYTENLWKDPMANFFLQSVVHFRKGKGILFLEVEKYSAEKVMDWTEKAKEPDGPAVNENNISISIEEDGACRERKRSSENEVIHEESEDDQVNIDINFWRALPRLKVPSEESSPRKKKYFQCAIQNKLPLLKHQVLAEKKSTPSFIRSSERSGKNRNSSSGKPLISGEISPLSDDVFVGGQDKKEQAKFIYDNEAGMAAGHIEIEAVIPRPMVVNVDVHPPMDFPSILTNENEMEQQPEVEIGTETENNETLKGEPKKITESQKIDLLVSGETGSPTEIGLFTLSGDEADHKTRNAALSNADLQDSQPDRSDSGSTAESLYKSQTGDFADKANSALPLSAKDLKSVATSFTGNSAEQNYENGPQIQNVEKIRQLNSCTSPGSDSLGSGGESGYVTSPAISPEGSNAGSFLKHDMGIDKMNATINVEA